MIDLRILKIMLYRLNPEILIDFNTLDPRSFDFITNTVFIFTVACFFVLIPSVSFKIIVIIIIVGRTKIGLSISLGSFRSRLFNSNAFNPQAVGLYSGVPFTLSNFLEDILQPTSIKCYQRQIQVINFNFYVIVKRSSRSIENSFLKNLFFE